jgi:hypothetical protein
VSENRGQFPIELVRAQQRVWACEASTRAFVLAGPDAPVVDWSLPRQIEFARLRAAQRAAQAEVEQHPLIASAIADHHWAATIRALRQAACESGSGSGSGWGSATGPGTAAA